MNETNRLLQWRRRFTMIKRLSWKQLLLISVVFLLNACIRLAVLVIPFRLLSKVLGVKGKSTPEDVPNSHVTTAAKIGWVAEAVGRHTPWTSKCLDRAITTQLLLRLFRVPSTLYLGVGKDDANHMIAHAWLRCGSQVVTGADEVHRVQTVAQFASLTAASKAGLAMKEE